jgi:cytochrome c
MSSSKKIWDSKYRRHIIEQPEADVDIPNGDYVLGQKIYNGNCGGCHTLDGNKWLGPPLRDIYNRKAVSKKFYYSKNCINLKGVYWSKNKLFMFLRNPEEFIEETAMVFDGMPDPYDRASVIDYLQWLKVNCPKPQN